VTASNEREQVSRLLLRSTFVGGTTGTATVRRVRVRLSGVGRVA
jgi:hypothetical protein